MGELRLADLLTFHRPREKHAVLVFRNPLMTGLRQVHWGDPVVLEAAIDQRVRSHITIGQPGELGHKLVAHFSQTRTLQEQIKAGLEAAIKAGVEAGSQGGVHGITAKVYAELSLKLWAEYQRQWGEQTTRSNTEETTYTRKVTKDDLADGPIVVNYEGVRSTNKEQRPVRAAGDYEHSVELIDETGAGENPPRIQLICPSWAEFRQVVQGFAPRDRKIERDGHTHVEPTAFYEQFIGSPLRGAELDALSAPAEGAVELLVEYDNVLAQDIKII